MKSLKQITALVLTLSICLSMFPTIAFADTSPPPDGLKVEATGSALFTGDVTNLQATVTVGGVVVEKPIVEWSVSPGNTAAIRFPGYGMQGESQNVNLLAMLPGTATITATYRTEDLELTDSCIVTVVAPYYVSTGKPITVTLTDGQVLESFSPFITVLPEGQNEWRVEAMEAGQAVLLVKEGDTVVRTVPVQSNQYFAYWNDDGKWFSSVVQMGMMPECPETPMKPGDMEFGYVFTGWSPKPSEDIEQTTIFSAQYEKQRLYNVSLNKPTVSLTVGAAAGTEQLVCNASPDPALHGETVVWKSSNLSVATVSQDGLITAKTTGATTVQVAVGNFSAQCEVFVTTESGYYIYAAARKQLAEHIRDKMFEEYTAFGGIKGISKWWVDAATAARATLVRLSMERLELAELYEKYDFYSRNEGPCLEEAEKRFGDRLKLVSCFHWYDGKSLPYSANVPNQYIINERTHKVNRYGNPLWEWYVEEDLGVTCNRFCTFNPTSWQDIEQLLGMEVPKIVKGWRKDTHSRGYGNPNLDVIDAVTYVGTPFERDECQWNKRYKHPEWGDIHSRDTSPEFSFTCAIGFSKRTIARLRKELKNSV